jgi:hypothetical protein
VECDGDPTWDVLESANTFCENEGAAIGGNPSGIPNINDDSCTGFLI